MNKQLICWNKTTHRVKATSVAAMFVTAGYIVEKELPDFFMEIVRDISI